MCSSDLDDPDIIPLLHTPAPCAFERDENGVFQQIDVYKRQGVDAGMGCVADIQTQAAFKTYWAKRLEEDPDIDPYNDLFCDLMEENAKAHPKYQGDCGDWLNWTVPDTDCNLPIFASGWGDGYYSMRLRWFEDMDEDENRPCLLYTSRCV